MIEKSKKKELKKKIDEKIEECNSILEFSTEAMKGLNTVEKKIIFSKENLESIKYNARWNKEILTNIRDRRVYQFDPNFDPYLNAYDKGVTRLQNFTKKLLSSMNDIENRMDFVTIATSNSDVNMGTGCRILGNYLNDNRENEVVNAIAFENPWDNPFISRDSLKEKILPIKTHLANTLDNVWDTLLFEGRKEENRPPALLMREFISDFLHTLAPRDEILKLDWCKKSEKENPTQRSMVIFIILGPNEDFEWNNNVYKPIVELATGYRRIYEKLNEYTHYRGDYIPKDVKIQLRAFAEQIQNYTLEIIKLREIYSS